jgi:hypothetical protein
MTSPPDMVAIDPQVWKLTLSLKKWTEPSRKPTTKMRAVDRCGGALAGIER